MEPAQTVGQVFSPLDEKLELQPGSLTPRQLSHLAHFASVVSFERAAKFLMQHHGVQVSASTSRRQTESIGASAEAVQNEQAKEREKQEAFSSGKESLSSKDMKQVISSDGSYISLRRKVFAEVKTAVVGEVQRNTKRSSSRPDQEVKMTHITYFSRMIDSQTFTELASGEIARRGFFQAKQVGAVSDGAEWIQHFIDAHREDAVRILDFYHACQYLSDIATLFRNAGTALKESWLDEQFHELKHQGPRKVLEEVNRLLRDHPYIEELKQAVHYLQKREKMMQYPLFQQQGWPIGSGSAESANTHVVQSRMSGPGMHWEPRNVNPMLALRTGECNDRWDETRKQAFRHRLQARLSTRLSRQKKRYEELKQKVEKDILRLVFLYYLHKPKTTNMHSIPCISALVPLSTCIPETKNTCRPTPSHPWRRYSLAKK
jgi:hypothetical protein